MISACETAFGILALSAGMLLFENCSNRLHDTYISIGNRHELHEWFRYSPDRDIVISGHRGGMLAGYPENCIESFAKPLTLMPSFFEIDPRLTKDSIIVLMHDSTIDRTTNGTGRLSDYTYTELRNFRLKDRDGNITAFQIPTLEESIRWSQGKTILNLDIKDVPVDMMVDYICSLTPVPDNVMYTVHTPEQAMKILKKDPQAMFSVWCRNMDEFNGYEQAGFPWSQAMAYVGPKMLPENEEMYRELHKRGVMCMISVAPTHDRLDLEEDRIDGYMEELESGCDVIETDYPYLFVQLVCNK